MLVSYLFEEWDVGGRVLLILRKTVTTLQPIIYRLNFQLEKIEGNVNSEFELEYLLLEGHCFETGSGNPPRGLQMTLGTEQEPVVVDTIVMANLGYLQLKSNPGRWFLKLKRVC